MDNMNVVSGELTKEGLIHSETNEMTATSAVPENESNDVDMERGLKRPLEAGDSAVSAGVKPRTKKPKVPGANSLPKNALMQLNEAHPGLEFQLVSQVGPIHNPVFTMSVTIDGVSYEGTGRTKQRARHMAAEKAVAILMPNATVAPVPEESAPPAPTPPKPKAPTNGNTTPTSKNPVMILNEMRPGTKYETESSTGEGLSAVFVMSVVVDGQTFHGTGRSKKIAKARAAQTALQQLFMMQFACSPGDTPGDDSPNFVKAPPPPPPPSKPVTPPSEKNAIMRLNELYFNAIYEYTEQVSSMPSMAPPSVMFSCAITIENRVFNGVGGTKKQAKLAAALTALAALEASGLLALREKEIEENKKSKKRGGGGSGDGTDGKQDQGTHPKKAKKNPPLPKNALMRLNDLYSSLDYRVISGDDYGTSFSVAVTIKGQQFVGNGTSKRAAKLLAAETALLGLGLWTKEDQMVKTMVASENAARAEKRRQKIAAAGGPRTPYVPRPGFGSVGWANRGASAARGGNWRGRGRGRGGRGGGRGRGKQQMDFTTPMHFVKAESNAGRGDGSGGYGSQLNRQNYGTTAGGYSDAKYNTYDTYETDAAYANYAYDDHTSGYSSSYAANTATANSMLHGAAGNSGMLQGGGGGGGMAINGAAMMQPQQQQTTSYNTSGGQQQQHVANYSSGYNEQYSNMQW